MTIVVAGIVILDSPVEGILGGLIGILRGSRGVAGGVRGGCSGGNGEEGGNGKEDLKIERVIKVDVNVKQKTKTFFKLKQIEKEGWEHFNFKIQNQRIMLYFIKNYLDSLNQGKNIPVVLPSSSIKI